MTWHLKDRELEKKLIELCPRFLSALDLAVYLSDDNENCVLVEATRQKNDIELADNVFYFCMDELEEVPEYNPKAWNEYPKVKPPYGVLMRIDFGKSNSNGYKAFYKRFEGEDLWCHADGTAMPGIYSDAIKRFRPWED